MARFSAQIWRKSSHPTGRLTRINDDFASSPDNGFFHNPEEKLLMRWQEADGLHLDLKGLSPPEPMIIILREIDNGAGGPLIVHMDRDPVYLYQELEDRGWSGHLIERGRENGAALLTEAGPVTLILRRDTTA